MANLQAVPNFDALCLLIQEMVPTLAIAVRVEGQH